jgi:hypothetical protein
MSYATSFSSRAHLRTVSRTAFIVSLVSQHMSMSSTSSQRPALWNPSAGPSGVCVNEYSTLLR